MLHWKRKSAGVEESKMEFTPMIDVVFLLLIFFLCTIKFRILEGKIPAFLPRTEGVNPSVIDPQLERLEVRIDRISPVDVDDPDWIWHEDQIRIRVGPRELSGLRELHDVLKTVKALNPEVKSKIHPGRGSLYIDSVKIRSLPRVVTALSP